MLITGDTVIGDMLDTRPELGDVLLNKGLHCLGCPASRGETLAEACEIHGIAMDTLLSDLNGN